MAKTRVQKEEEVRDYVQGLKGAKAVVFAELTGLRVADSTAFRRSSQEQEVIVRMAKKTLLRRAVKEAGLELDEAAISGKSVTMLLGSGDEVAPAKALAELQKAHEEGVTVLGGFLESNWMTAEQITALAKLPNRDQLIAQVVGSVRAPLSGLVGVLQGNLRNLVSVLNAVKDSKA